MAKTGGTEKRRSDRLMLTIPLQVIGEDSSGLKFRDEARTVTLNRHGARIHVARRLQSGQTLRVINIIAHHESDFRVVGPVAPFTEKGGDWGVESLDAKDNIWGIQFPPPETGDATASKGLLECRKCHSVALLPLSLVEVEVLETAGIFTRACKTCEATTHWGYAEKQMAMEAPPGEAAMIAEAQTQITATARGLENRKHRRVSLQLPIFVRDFYGGVEITKTENVSKGGFCFASEKTHLVGEGVMAVCPYNSQGQNIEVHARIVRRTDIADSNQKIYGVRYDPQTN